MWDVLTGCVTGPSIHNKFIHSDANEMNLFGANTNNDVNSKEIGKPATVKK